MKRHAWSKVVVRLSCLLSLAAAVLVVQPLVAGLSALVAQEPKGEVPSSYDQVSPVLQGKQSFAAMMAKDKADKPAVMDRQKKLLDERYQLTPKLDPNVKMTRGKPIAVGPTAKLPQGMTWDKLAGMTPEAIRDQGVFPKGFLPLPHPNHAAGGMLFPQMEIKQLKRVSTLR